MYATTSEQQQQKQHVCCQQQAGVACDKGSPSVTVDHMNDEATDLRWV